MKTGWLRRLVVVLAVVSLLVGCDAAPPVRPDGGEAKDVRLGVGYSTANAPGGDTYVISFDVLGEPDTTYEVRVRGADGAPGDPVEVTTNERGVGVGSQEVTGRGFYDVVVADPEGSVVAVETLEVG